MAKWYSANDEDYSHSEIEDAVTEVFDDPEIAVGEVRSVWEGEVTIKKAGEYAPEDMVTLISDRAYAMCGYVDGWPMNCTKEQGQELNKMVAEAINTWASIHGLQPTFGTVKDVREIKVRLTSADGAWEYVNQ